MENDFDDFCRRFQELGKEAQAFGIESLSIVLEQDSLSKTEAKDFYWHGGPVQALGMLEWGKVRLVDAMNQKSL